MDKNYIQLFLKDNMNKLSLDRNDVIKKTGLSSSTIHDLINGYKMFPAFDTIIKLSDAFNTSIDQMLGLENNISYNQFRTITSTEAMQNIKKFLNQYLKTQKTKSSKFSQQIGLNTNTIKRFMNNETSALGTKAIQRIAIYTGISIDEIIGRVLPKK